MSDENTNKYFADLESDKIGSAMIDRVERYYDHLQNTGRLKLMKRSYEQYYKAMKHKGSYETTGQNNELKLVYVNHYRNLVSHRIALAYAERPAFQPKAINTDYESEAQCILAGGLLEYYMRQKHVERYSKKAGELCLIYGEGFSVVDWDTESGEKYGVENQGTDKEKIKYNGDLEFSNYSPIDVIRDFHSKDYTKNKWHIIRTFVNRYDMIAQYPDLADKIRQLPDATETSEKTRLNWAVYSNNDGETNDEIVKYTLIHDKTPSVPDGRRVEILDKEIVLFDGPLPYRNSGVFRICAAEQDDTCFGYSLFFDILILQQCLDKLYSAVITNQAAFGVQNIIMPEGINISVKQIADGLNLITEPINVQGQIRALQLCASPKEVFQMIDILERVMETLSGVNSTARGNPEASLKSGAALALVQSMAIQFNSDFQQSVTLHNEDLATSIVNMLQDFADAPRVALITGKSKRTIQKEFKGSDIDRISRVHVEITNPLTYTIAGKINMAEQLLNAGLIKDPDQYIQVLTTGRLEPAIEGVQSQLMLIKSENEAMLEFGTVKAIATDSHAQHILEHSVVLASPEARLNPQLVDFVLAHIQEHINLMEMYSMNNPNFLMMLGQQPLQMQGPGMPINQNINPDALAPQNKAQEPQVPGPQGAVAAKQPNMPNMPKNPLTNNQWNPGNGGL